MVTIIIISNDPHVMLLHERFQPLIKGQILIYSNYEQGLMAVFDKRPSSVFIQREIEGISADVIARQIKGLLRDSSPRIILMGALAGIVTDGVNCFDDSFDFAASEEELCSFFAEQLDKIPNLLWKEGQRFADHLPETAETHPTPKELFLIAQSESPPVSEPVAPVQPAHHTTAKASPARQSTAQPVIHDIRAAVPGNGTTVDGLQKRMEHIDNDDFSSFGWSGQQDSLFKRSRIYIAGMVVAFALGSALYLTGAVPAVTGLLKRPAPVASRQPAPQPAPAAVHGRSTSSRTGISSLPAIIPQHGKDLAYAAAHPGWERFSADGLEFLVFRSGATIKAIQLMASGSTGISSDMVSVLLQQSAGVGVYTVTKVSDKNGYLMQQSKLPDGTELVIYRKKSNDQVRGVVVTLP